MNLARLAPAIVGAALLITGTAHGQAAATKTTRTYDCTKAGNANKAACKTAAAATAVKPAPAKPAAAAPATVAKTTPARNYDCSKAGNANKAACKKAAPVAPAPAAATAPAASPVAATRATAARTTTTARTTTSGDAAVHAAGPNGATAQCKDGTYSKSAHRSGTCAGHKGVATWY